MKNKRRLVQSSLVGALLLALPAAAQAQFTYAINNGSIIITGYTGSGGAVTIPSTLNGLPVTAIGNYAFEGTSLTSVMIGNSVISIGDYAFYDCFSLASLMIGTNVTSIGDYAFAGDGYNGAGDYDLTSITIPNSVTTIGNYAFFHETLDFDGTGPTNVTIGSGVINIGEEAFGESWSLMAITVASNNPAYSSVDGVLFNKSQTTLIQYPASAETSSYTIPDSVTSIGDYAFYDCLNLTSVTIPNLVTSIGDYAFYNCSSLASVTIPNLVTSIGEGAFAECSSLTSVTIPRSVTSIGDSAFAGTSLTSAYFLGNAPSADSTVFQGDSATIYYLPGTTGWDTFDVNAVLWNPTTLYAYTTNNGSLTITEYYGSGGDLSVPGTINGLPVTGIGGGTFYDCNLTSVTIGTNVTSIGDGAFADNISLMAITVDTNNAAYSSVGGVLFDKSQTTLIQYPANAETSSYTIPNTVTNIGDYAFYNCSSLTSLTIGTNVISIGNYAFSGNFDSGDYNLTGITIPNSVISIGNYTFFGDTLSFDGTGPTNVTIGSGVTSIGEEAFGESWSLMAITVASNNPAYSSVDGVLFNKSQTTLIQYPGSNPGGAETSGYTIPISVITIGDYAFSDCINLTSVMIPNSVITIGDYAFNDCYSLTSITIPNSVTSIGNYAFQNDNNLTNVIIGNNVRSIGEEAFALCQNLTSVYFTGDAPNADYSAFEGSFYGPIVYYLPGTRGWENFASLTGITPIVWLSGVQFTAGPTNGPVGLTIQFNCTNVDSGGNLITNWNWAFGDGATSTNQNPSHVYTTVGSFTPILIAVNNLGTLFPGYGPSITTTVPTLQFTASPTNGFSPLSVQFTSPGADSGGNAISDWHWTFSGGNNSTAQNPTHLYATTGSFTPSLVVTNNLSVAVFGAGPSITTYSPPGLQSITRTNGNFQLSWNTVSSDPAAGYQLQYTTNLASHLWFNLGGVLTGISPTLTLTDTNRTGRQRFYRLVASLGNNIFEDTFDPPTGVGIGISYDGGDVANPAVGVVSGVGTAGSAALQIESSFTNGPNGYGYLAGQWQDLAVSGNTDTNLSDYYLSFDAYVKGDSSHQSGGGFSLEVQEGTGTNFTTTFPQGQLQTYQAYQGGSDLLLPQSEVWQHFTINLGGPTFQSPLGTNITFNPTGGTWQLIFQMNTGDWGAEPQTNSTLIIDNLVLTILTPP